MLNMSKRAIAINVGAGAIILTAAVTFVHTTLARPYFEVCSTRYKRQLSMQLDHNGTPLAPLDLQAVANGQDEGVLENLTIAQFNEGPTKFAMGVKLASGTAEQRSEAGPQGGISLPWIPSLLEQPKAACLSYNIYLPADFNFDQGGTLPGLFATTINGQYVDNPHVAANLSWQSKGVPKLFVQSHGGATQMKGVFDAYERVLPRGRWLHVDQEVILNTPGQPDGTVRLWFDGKLETEVKAAPLRPDDTISIAGVAGDVFFGGSGTGGHAKADTTIWLSPFELRWN